MTWGSFDFWSEEEKRIQDCIIEALSFLIAQGLGDSDDEPTISGKLRPLLYASKKRQQLAWTLQPEASCFIEDYAYASGHPDFRFSQISTDYDQYDYDVECKLIRPPREGKKYDYCKHYVQRGIRRFKGGTYALSSPALGTMIGYWQAGDAVNLLNTVNDFAAAEDLGPIVPTTAFKVGDVTLLAQPLLRANDGFTLYHIWADLRRIDR